VAPAEQPPDPEEDATLEEPAAKPAPPSGLEAEVRAMDLDGFDAMFDQAVREVKAEQAAAPAGQPAGTPAPVAATAAKEPWQVTPDEYVGNRTDKDEVAVARAAHPQHVKRALDEGKPVPAEVLAKYRHNVWAQKELNRRAEGVSDAEFFWRAKLTGSGRYDAAKAAGYSDDVAGRLSKTLWHYLTPEQKSRLAPPILAMYGQGESPQAVQQQAPAAGKTLADFGLKVSRTVTIAGKPVWEVTGNTREHKDSLKALGARWYGPRKAWSFSSDPTQRILAKLAGAAEGPAAGADKSGNTSANAFADYAREHNYHPRLAQALAERDEKAMSEFLRPPGPGKGQVLALLEEGRKKKFLTPEDEAFWQEKLKEPEAAPAPARRHTIGANDDGRNLFEDERGVRYYVEDGVRVYEPVALHPISAGVKPTIGPREGTLWEAVGERVFRERVAKGKAEWQAYQLQVSPPDGWETHLIKARVYAKDLGVHFTGDDTTGQIVDRIKTALAAAGKPTQQRRTVTRRNRPEGQGPAVDTPASGTQNENAGAQPAPAAGQDRLSGADIIKKAAKEGVTGIDEAVKALHELFGGGRGLRGGLIPLGGLDEEAYRKARPHFVASFNAFKASGKSLMDFMKFCVQSFGEAIRPYLKHFMAEVQAGTYEQPYQPQEEEAGNGDADNAGGREPREAAAGDDRAGDEGPGPENAPGAGPGGEAPGLPEGSGEAVDGGVPGRGEQNSLAESKKPQPDRAGAGDRGRVEAGLGGNAGNVPGLRGRDYVIPPGGLSRAGGWKTAAKNNLDAIELFKKIAAENRPATPEEQAILSRYVGWGASELANKMFPGYAYYRRIIEGQAHPDWRDLVKRMLSLLTPEEIATAARSTQYAHYTSEPIVRSIYQALSRMGFTGGKILEPGSGVGNFIGMLPESMKKNSAYTAVEMDHVTAGIAKLLYPNQNVQQADFVKLTLPHNFFDAAIGNPPFGKTTILADPEYRKNRFSLHNFFFAKALDRVRPGGLLVFVTSRYTMDSQADQARAYMAERADLLGAIRLPQSAFAKSAGTEVVTDVLFLQKREPGAAPSGQAWTGQKTIQVGDQSVPVNEYFADHPEMVLGRHSLEGSMYGQNEYTVMPMEGDIAAQFADAAMKLPEKVYQKARKTTKKSHDKPAVIERDWNPKNRKEGGVYLSDSGAVMKTDFGSGVPVESLHKLSPADRALLASYIPLRDALKLSHKAQWEGKDWEQALEALNREYDRFVKKHGRIKEFTVRTKTIENEDGDPQTVEFRILKNERVLQIDTEWALVTTLEEVKPDGTIVKAAPLLGRTIKVPTTPEIKSVPDALAVSLDRTGALDLDDVAELSGKPREEVVAALGDLIYEDPGGSGFVLADEYLSGNVVKKLDEARAAAKVDARYQRNVEALEKNQPEPLAPKDIVVTMGAPWVPVGYYGTFASEVLGMPLTEVTRHPADNSWTVLPVSSRKGKTYSPQGLRGAGNEWGTPDRGPNEILDAILNNRQIRITRTERVAGSTKTFLDKEATAAANEKAKRIREKFASWVWSDSSRAAELLNIYNTKVNVINGRKFDGSHLTMPGMSQHFRPYDHQKRGIWRILQTGNAYLAHAVGAGKTATMIAAGMEMRRLGMVQKPLYVVPNHMLGQFAQEFQELYPMASILVADEQNFHTDNRRRFVAQATMNNPDAIILTHSAFGLLRVKEETLAPVRKKFMASMQAALEEMRDDEDSARMRIKRMEQRIEQAEQRFDSMISGGDNVVTFEELGADFLFVDEAHMFRKLDFTTNQQIKGIDPNGSKRALDLYIKTLWLEHMNPGRSHVFASGTPITNTLAELYTLQRFFGQEQLDEDDVDHFDAWSAMYGQAATDYEMNASGMYEPVTRFARFVNIPELMSRVRMFMDVLTGSQLGTRVTRPAVRGGTPELVIAPKNEALKAYQEKVLQPRIKKSRAWKPSKAQPGNPDPLINIITDGKLASIDMRFVVPGAKNDPGSKLNQFIDGIIAAYEDTRDNTYMTEFGSDTPSPVKGGAQICFYNVGFGDAVARNRGFDARAWLMGRLKKAGI
ncbi:MAG: DEAD/DEAH box helicase family protein, partial [Thermodesulfobacteriota bacterium]